MAAVVAELERRGTMRGPRRAARGARRHFRTRTRSARYAPLLHEGALRDAAVGRGALDLMSGLEDEAAGGCGGGMWE